MGPCKEFIGLPLRSRAGGGGGHDGLPSDGIVYYYGQQLAHCEDDMRTFFKSSDCYWVLSYAPFDKHIASLQTAHDCCSFCAAKCNCGGTQCISEAKQIEVQCTPQPLVPVRIVSESQKEVLMESLQELKLKVTVEIGSSPFGAISGHGFLQELIADVVASSEYISDMKGIQTLVPVFRKSHVRMILEIFSEIFEDIDDTASQQEQHSAEMPALVVDQESFDLETLISCSDFDMVYELLAGDLDFLDD